jgi:AcrR family transcriptional regulator
MLPAMDKSSRQRILEATIEAIDRGGETSVRIIDVSEAAGVTQGLVTYHFRTRDQLIAEASTARFVATISEDIAIMQAALPSLKSVDDLRQLAEKMTTLLLLPERVAARRRRLNAMGFAIQSPTAKEAITAVQTQVVDAFTDMIVYAQTIGIARTDLDARAMATMILSYTFGIVMKEFDQNPPSDDDLFKVITAFVMNLLAAQ